MKIAVLDDYQGAFSALGFSDALKGSGHEVEIFTDTVTGDALVQRLQSADAVVLIQQRSALAGDVIVQLPNLRFISQTGYNLAHLDLVACQERGIVVSAAGAGTPHATSELVWGLVLAQLRQIPQQSQRLKEGHWMGPPMGQGLAGKTLGIYAYGKIGKLVADVGRAFQMNVVCWGREGSLARAVEAGFAAAPSREAFFAGADVITLHLPLSPQTRGIINPADLAAMKPSALIVNTSRAEIIASGALAAAVTAGRPGFAAVDVFEQEPVLGANHPLIGLPNVLCTPHIGYAEEGRYRALLGIAVDQLQAFALGRPINTVSNS